MSVWDYMPESIKGFFVEGAQEAGMDAVKGLTSDDVFSMLGISAGNESANKYLDLAKTVVTLGMVFKPSMGYMGRELISAFDTWNDPNADKNQIAENMVGAGVAFFSKALFGDSYLGQVGGVAMAHVIKTTFANLALDVAGVDINKIDPNSPEAVVDERASINRTRDEKKVMLDTSKALNEAAGKQTALTEVLKEKSSIELAVQQGVTREITFEEWAKPKIDAMEQEFLKTNKSFRRDTLGTGRSKATALEFDRGDAADSLEYEFENIPDEQKIIFKTEAEYVHDNASGLTQFRNNRNAVHEKAKEKRKDWAWGARVPFAFIEGELTETLNDVASRIVHPIDGYNKAEAAALATENKAAYQLIMADIAANDNGQELVDRRSLSVIAAEQAAEAAKSTNQPAGTDNNAKLVNETKEITPQDIATLKANLASSMDADIQDMSNLQEFVDAYQNKTSFVVKDHAAVTAEEQKIIDLHTNLEASDKLKDFSDNSIMDTFTRLIETGQMIDFRDGANTNASPSAAGKKNNGNIIQI